MSAITYRFLVATEPIPGLPGLERGDMVIRTAVEILDGGYEYDVWRKLDDGMVAKTRIGNRAKLAERTVEGADMAEVVAKANEERERLVGNG